MQTDTLQNVETLNSPASVLVVDDEDHFLTAIRFILAQLGIKNVYTCNDGRNALDTLKRKPCQAVLLDVTMPGISGLEVLRLIKSEFPEVAVVMVTALADIDMAVKCTKEGAFDYLLKPVEVERLSSALLHAIEISDSRRENAVLREKLINGKLNKPEVFSEFVTQSVLMYGIFAYIEAIAPSRQPVLVTGETGTGKELAARAIHAASGRSGAFVAVNVGGLAETLVDDELFGHCKGAFTGALNERLGMIEQAAGGTLFLDEIGDLGLPMQIKLLRLIQEGSFQALGADLQRSMDARIVVATNRDVEELVNNGAFRKDLYYRLSTHRIHLPPLRERKEDIPYLLDKFLEQAAQELDKRKPTPPPQIYPLLATYDFPGNVRELRGMVFDAVSRHTSGTLSLQAFREKIGKLSIGGEPVRSDAAQGEAGQKVIFSDSLPTLREVQELLIEKALEAADGNQTIAAGILGMSRRALNSRLSRRGAEK